MERAITAMTFSYFLMDNPLDYFRVGIIEEIKIKRKQLYGSFLWMTFNYLKATEPLRGGSLLFTTKFLESPGTHVIDLGRMKG